MVYTILVMYSFSRRFYSKHIQGDLNLNMSNARPLNFTHPHIIYELLNDVGNTKSYKSLWALNRELPEGVMMAVCPAGCIWWYFRVGRQTFFGLLTSVESGEVSYLYVGLGDESRTIVLANQTLPAENGAIVLIFTSAVSQCLCVENTQRIFYSCGQTTF